MFDNGVYQSIDTIRQLLDIIKDENPVIIDFNNSFDPGLSLLGEMLFHQLLREAEKLVIINSTISKSERLWLVI
jgi:hypothetical protein